MPAIDLTQGEWQFKQYPLDARRMRDLEKGDWHGTAVPGSIYTSLINDKQIERNDLFANPENYKWVSDSPWIYRTSFETNHDFCASDRIDLVCECLDTFASVWLNEKLIVKTNNAFIEHRINISKYIQTGKNSLMIKFDPAKAQAESIMKRYTKFDTFNNPYRAYVRKPQSSFGWDFCPHLPGCGILDGIYIEAIDTARIENIHIQTIEASQHNADVKVSIELDKIKNTKLTAEIAIEGSGQKFTQAINFHPGEKRSMVIFYIERPFLWNPRGYGVQFLYDLKTVIKNDDKIIDQKQSKFGIRTIKLQHSKDEKNRSFEFIVNDRPIKIKGAKFIPPSVIYEQTDKRTEKLLHLAADANINMLRVWGGGSYGSDKFYRLCDELGILVWQDFMFTEAYYPDRQFFLDEVKTEARSVIRKLRNHASLAIWCGNDNCHQMHKQGLLGKSKKFHGQKIYNNLLPGLLHTLDPSREYVPTTPFSDASAVDIQSLPNLEVLEQIVPEKKISPASFELEKLNYKPNGNSQIAEKTSEHYPPAKNIDELINHSQLTQAKLIKEYIENLRAADTSGMEMLTLQLNDACPAVSGSVIDHNSQAKTSYEAIKQAYAPVLAAFVPEYEPADNSQLKKLSSLSVVIANDTANPITAQLDCCLKNFNGITLDSVSLPVTVGPNSVSAAIKLAKNFAMALKSFDTFVSIELISDTKVIARNDLFYAPEKYLNKTE